MTTHLVSQGGRVNTDCARSSESEIESMRVLFLRYHTRWPRVSLAMTMPKSPFNDRGVYVEDIAPPGEHWYKFVLSNGKIGIVHLPDELVDSTVLDEYLRCLLDTIDPPYGRRLKLV